MLREYLSLAAMKHLEQQRGKQEAEECDDYSNCSITDAENAGARHQLVMRRRVDQTVPESGHRQHTGQQNSKTDEVMDSSTGGAL